MRATEQWLIDSGHVRAHEEQKARAAERKVVQQREREREREREAQGRTALEEKFAASGDSSRRLKEARERVAARQPAVPQPAPGPSRRRR